MFGSLDISVSGLVAQRARLEAISANLANKDSIYDAKGNYSPYRRRIVMFEQGDPVSGKAEGVHVSRIALDQSPFQQKYEPGNKNAVNGYVSYPNVDSAMEMVNALDASRAYEANITAAEATKNMISSSLRLLA